jgi:UPF0042 nucleotide-binding protein
MEFVIITGISGAGKSRAANAFEDMGFYCVDNMPPSLIQKFAEICAQSNGNISKVAFVTDVRGGSLFESLFVEIDKLRQSNFDFKLLFLDASDETIVKRYKETRRKHPLDNLFGSVTEAIANERRILQPVRERADYIIDTTNLSLAQLRDRITTIFAEGNKKDNIIVNCMSFGFKFGIPIDADLVFDVRCFPNPFYIDELKPLTGLDEKVRDYVFSFKETNEFMDKLYDMIDFLLPFYIAEGKTHLTISIGCTGGKHRSVAMSEKLCDHINDKGYYAVVSHRDIKHT